MRYTPILIFITAVLLTQPVAAHGPNHGPIGKLRARVEALEVRIQDLEKNAPSSSVEGRTYCFVLDLLVMRGRAFNASEELQSSVIRRTANFSGGAFSAALLSHIRNNQLDDGTVTLLPGSSPDPLLATYTQTGNKIDIVFPDASTATWYVSNDGSLIHGSSISSAGPFPGPTTVGITRSFTLVENDTCDMEGQ